MMVTKTKKRKAESIPERTVYFRCKNVNCGFVGCGVVTKPYIRCTRCNQWSSIWKQAVTKEEYDKAWG